MFPYPQLVSRALKTEVEKSYKCTVVRHGVFFLLCQLKKLERFRHALTDPV